MKASNRMFRDFTNYESQDSFVEVKDIKKGDVIYECDDKYAGINFEFTAVSDSIKTENGWECVLKNNEGEVFDIFVAFDTLGIYLPQFYRIPKYFEEDKKGGFYYVIK